MILVTGSSGLIGRAVREHLATAELPVRTFDIGACADQDSRNIAALEQGMSGVTGIIHLAAISRVVWAQENPALCHEVNVEALRNLLAIAAALPVKPWVIFASSREVYGDAQKLPVQEDAPLKPLNVYARSKIAGETLMAEARSAGLVANVVRFSNVYGCPYDHADRVVTAFARTAARGGTLRLEGADNMFDFTHVKDAASGLYRAVVATIAGQALPPIHFLTGQGTTLGELAELAIGSARRPIDARIAPPRSYDVARFVGDPTRASAELGWSPRIGIAEGIAELIERFDNDEVGEAPAPFIDAMLDSGNMEWTSRQRTAEAR